MDNVTVIYGASDDLLEIVGAFREEMNPPNEEFYVAVSDGTLLTVNYDGQWNIRTKVKGSSLIEVRHAAGEEGSHTAPYDELTSYSDLAIFDDKVKWVALSTDFAKKV